MHGAYSTVRTEFIVSIFVVNHQELEMGRFAHCQSPAATVAAALLCTTKKGLKISMRSSRKSVAVDQA